MALTKAFGAEAIKTFLSNPLLVAVDDMSSCQSNSSKSGCEFTFELQNNVAQQYPKVYCFIIIIRLSKRNVIIIRLI